MLAGGKEWRNAEASIETMEDILNGIQRAPPVHVTDKETRGYVVGMAESR